MGSRSFTASYDAYGNNLNLTYDAANQLVKAQKNGKYTEVYTYDATGYRVGRDVGGVLTDYVYWGNNLLYETTSGKAIDYIWAEGKLLAKVENSGTTYFHHDYLGSSKLQTDESGNVVSTDVTQPFGPRICADAVEDELANLDKVDTAASKIVFDAISGAIRAPKDANGYQTGELYTTELKSGVDARVVKLDWTGSGVTFYVSTDGSTWSQLQKDQPFILGTPGRSLYLKAVLAADASSVLDRYLLQINPTGFNLFTGKMLTEETGLVYFGARWYDPEVGRFITVDPAKDGENWYAYCWNNPINRYDPDGRIAPAIVAALYVYITTLVSSPDIYSDISIIQNDAMTGDVPAAIIDGILTLVPEIPAGEGKVVSKFITEFGPKAEKFIIGEFGVINKSWRGLKGGVVQIHHLIEKRFASIIGVSGNKILSVAISKAQHAIYTARWRQLYKYGVNWKNVPLTKLLEDAKKVYYDNPKLYQAIEDWLKALRKTK